MYKIEGEDILISMKTYDNEKILNNQDVLMDNPETKVKEFASKGITFISQKQELSRKISAEKIEELEKIGEGKCANIYKNGSIVYKILKENSNSKKFYSKEMLQKLVGIKSDLCVFPNEILEDNNGNLLCYSMDLASGRKMKDIIAMLPFEQLQSVIAKAEQCIEEISRQDIMFDDMHDDNVMWNEETKKYKYYKTKKQIKWEKI